MLKRTLVFLTIALSNGAATLTTGRTCLHRADVLGQPIASEPTLAADQLPLSRSPLASRLAPSLYSPI